MTKKAKTAKKPAMTKKERAKMDAVLKKIRKKTSATMKTWRPLGLSHEACDNQGAASCGGRTEA